jgi:hypothetical protein
MNEDQLFLSPNGRRVALQSSSTFVVAIVTVVLSALTKSENLIAEFEIIYLQSSILTPHYLPQSLCDS